MIILIYFAVGNIENVKEFEDKIKIDLVVENKEALDDLDSASMKDLLTMDMSVMFSAKEMQNYLIVTEANSIDEA